MRAREVAKGARALVRTPAMNRWLLAGWVGASLLGCGGGGQYGYARAYSNLGAEAPYAGRAREAVYDEVRRLPHRYENQLISWFGVVQSVEPGQGGATRVSMQVRTHQERHLCEEPEEGSCRVTVSEQNGGPFTALLPLSGGDTAGGNRPQTGAAVRGDGPVGPGGSDPG